MIHRRKITKKNRPKTVAEAFNLFAQLNANLPNTGHGEDSLSQLRLCFMEAVNAFLKFHDTKHQDCKNEYDALKRILAESERHHKQALQLLGLGGDATIIQRIKFGLTIIFKGVR